MMFSPIEDSQNCHVRFRYKEKVFRDSQSKAIYPQNKKGYARLKNFHITISLIQLILRYQHIYYDLRKSALLY